MGHFTPFGFYCQRWYPEVVGGKFLKNLLISGIMLGLSISFITSTFKIVQRSRRLIDVKNELSGLESQEVQLEKDLQYYKSPEFIEEEARNKLNMVKKGEVVYLKPRVLGDDLLGAQDQRTSQKHAEKRGWFLQGLFDKIKEILLLFQS